MNSLKLAQKPRLFFENLNNQEINLADYKGKTVLISVVPDIDTRVCSLQTKRFNQEAAKLDGVQIITVSNNTVEEQANWCAAEGVEMEMLHDTEDSFVQLMVCIFQKWAV